jgi:hypothetical protein
VSGDHASIGTWRIEALQQRRQPARASAGVEKRDTVGAVAICEASNVGQCQQMAAQVNVFMQRRCRLSTARRLTRRNDA